MNAPESSHTNAETSHAPISGLWLGTLFWLLYTCVAIALRGVQWDENYEFAQAMLGQVVYDDAHPIRQYTLSAYNLQFYSSALILYLNEDPLWICGFRNFLFIASSVLPTFLLGTWLSGRSFVGHAATILFLIGIHLEFDGVYPQFIWPGMFSNGHIGIAYVLIFVGLLARGSLRWAGLMLGLMPAIHLGQMPPALLLAGLYAIHCGRTHNWCPLKHAIAWFSVGIVCCVFFYMIQSAFTLPPVTSGPYFSDDPARVIWEGRIATRDMHRAIPTGNIHIVTAAFLGIAIGGWLYLRTIKSPLAACWGWLSVYGFGVIVIVYSISAVHLLMGTNIPFLMLGWLPYRLLNHLAPLLLIMQLSLLATATKKETVFALFLPLAFLFELLKPIYPKLLGESLTSRYLTQNDSLFFILLALSVFFLLIHSRNRSRHFQIISFAIITGLIATRHQFGATVFLLVSVFAFAQLRVNLEGLHKRALPIAYALGALVLAGTLYQGFQLRTHLPIGTFERDLTALLEAKGHPDALIAAAPDQVLLQAQTGHPIFTDMATEFHASYRPSLGPSVQQMYEDVYGIWFEQRDTLALNWHTLWNERSPEEWRALKERYNIEYLVAPIGVHPQLDIVLESDYAILYQMPE